MSENWMPDVKQDVGTSTNKGELAALEHLWAESPDEQPEARIVVQAYLPQVATFGHDGNRDLVYQWPGGDSLKVGDIVLCPKTPRGRDDFEAMVVSLDASNHPYKGPVKSIIRKVR
jgi:hypothetical protein